MSRLSINELTTYRWSFEEDVLHYAEGGVRAIGVWRDKLTDFGEEKAVELIRDSQIRVTSLSWIGGFTSADLRSYDDQLQEAREAIELAAELGSPCVTLVTGPRGAYTHRHARRLFREAHKTLLPLAERANVLLAVEPMHESASREWTFLNDLGEAVQLVEDFESSPLRLAIDSYHFSRDPNFYEYADRIASKLAIVYLSDSRTQPNSEQDRCRLGEGTAPLRNFIEQIESRGFTGDYEVRLMGEAIETACYTKVLEQSQRYVRELLNSVCGPA
jgi:sugar phosphate isomerase/epimerase